MTAFIHTFEIYLHLKCILQKQIKFFEIDKWIYPAIQYKKKVRKRERKQYIFKHSAE